MLIEPMQSLTIADLSKHPNHLARVLDWLYSTWSDENNEFNDALILGSDRPGALLALIGDDPGGVIAFKRYKAVMQTRPELWINALFVVPKFRRLGIGSRLVQFGIERSIPEFTNQLFVYTDIPVLYESLG